MPLPASIRSLKAQLRTLSQPDFWSSALGLLLLMPLGWQIFNHFQQPSPVVKTPKPQSEPNATESIDSQSPTEDSAAAADLENSAVLDRLLDRAVQPNASVLAPPTSSPATANTSDTLDPSATSQFDAYALPDRFSGGSSISTTQTAPINPNPYASRSSIAQDILSAPYSATNNTTNNAAPRSALQNAFLDNSVEREAAGAPAAPNRVDVEDSLALIEPPSPPAPSTLELPTSPSLPPTPLPSSTPSTSLLPLPTPPLPSFSVEDSVKDLIVPPSPNPVPTSFNPNLNPVPTNLNPLPTPTQQTKLYPYVPERVYSSPLPALPPSGTGTNSNNNGLPPLPNPGMSPQSQNLPTNPTAVAPIPPTGNSEIELQAVPFSVERLIGGGEINTFANP
ncbi:MAG: hypothetical protein WBB29_11850 [Geitlerinemataceae cyanobacterium]